MSGAFLIVDPIVIRPDGNVTVFGLNNHFNPNMPSKLLSVVSPDEYRHTVNMVNKLLNKDITFNVKLCAFSCLCFCCSLSLSIIPPIIVHRHTKSRVRDILQKENLRIYNHLGLHWSLIKVKDGPLDFIEYVLKIDFIQKLKINQPD